MSFASWLCVKLRKGSKAPAKPSADALSNAQAGDDKANPHDSADALRIHFAAHDPQFPAKRDAAVAIILTAINAAAQAHGFTKKPKSWAKSGPLGMVSIHLQRNRYGFDCTINLGFQPIAQAVQDETPQGETPQSPWAENDFIPLGWFYPSELAGLGSAGTVAYLDVLEDSGALQQPISVLSDVALPWLLAHLTDPNAETKPFQY
jgi:hypothetical protein